MSKLFQTLKHYSLVIGYFGLVAFWTISHHIKHNSDGYFKGYKCLEDCSGHGAGYEWASEKGVDDPNDCVGYSRSFIEGCEAYVTEIEQEKEAMYDSYNDWHYSGW